MADATYADLLGSGILLHYDASDASSLFTDTSATIAASDGNEVRAITPQADAALSVNLTNVNGPAYRADYSSSGYAALEFDGSNDQLANASTGISTGAACFVLVSLRRIAQAGDQTVWALGSNLSHFDRVFFSGNAGNTGVQTAGGAGAFFAPVIHTPSTSDAYVLASILQNGQNEINSLGVCVGNRNAGNPSASRTGEFRIGAGPGVGFQPGRFALHEIMVVAGTCEWGQVLRAAKIMRSKWGITDPNAMPQKPTGGGTAGFTGIRGVSRRLGT